VIAPAAALAREVAGIDELTHDAVRGALRDAHALADLAQANPGVIGDAEQRLSVTCQERPTELSSTLVMCF
jgi:hypothetical protein